MRGMGNRSCQTEVRSMVSPCPWGRAFDIIAELAQADGELVSKSDLTERVWRGYSSRTAPFGAHRGDPQEPWSRSRHAEHDGPAGDTAFWDRGGSGMWMRRFNRPRPNRRHRPTFRPRRSISSAALRPSHICGSFVGLSRSSPCRAWRDRQNGAGAAGSQSAA